MHMHTPTPTPTHFSTRVRICVHACIYTYIHTYILNMYIFTNIYIYIYTPTLSCVYTDTYVHVCVYIIMHRVWQARMCMHHFSTSCMSLPFWITASGRVPEPNCPAGRYPVCVRAGSYPAMYHGPQTAHRLRAVHTESTVLTPAAYLDFKAAVSELATSGRFDEAVMLWMSSTFLCT